MTGGCSRKEGLEEGKVIISIACSYSPKDVGAQVINKSIDKFMEENPDIKVKKIWFSSSYWTKLMTMIAGGIPPDIFRVGPDYVPNLIQKGVLMPLDSFIEKSEVLKLKDFFLRFCGNTGLMERLSVKVLFTVLVQTGLRIEPCSLIIKICLIRQERGKQFGCWLGNIPLLVYQNGGRVFSEDGKRCLMDSPEAIEAFQFLVDLRAKDKVMPSYSELRDTDQLQLFQTGRLGMFLSGRYYASIVEKAVKGRIRWAVAP